MDPFNPWEFFQQSLNGNHHFTKPYNDWDSRDLSWVEDYVNDILSNVLPQPAETNKPSQRHDVFETHHYMIARLKLPKDVDPENIRVSFQTNELKIEGLNDNIQTIRLPANGLHKGSSATVKDGVLEVKIPKKKHDSFKEIGVRIL